MSWLEPDGDGVALRFATLEDERWSSAHTVARGDDWFVNWADFPSVVAIDDRLWAAHWLVRAAAGTYEYDVAVAVSIDGGDTWQAAITPHRDGSLSEHGFVSLYPAADGVGALWLDGRQMDRGMTLRSAVIAPDGSLSEELLADDLVCDCCQTDVAIGSNGPIAVFRNRTADEVRDIYTMRMIDGRWESGRPVADDGWQIAGCPVNGPAIAARGDEVVVSWFTAAGGHPRVRFARSIDGAASFGAPIDVATDRPLGRVGLALLGSGDAVVSWLEQVQDTQGLVMARIVRADGEPGAAVTIVETQSGRPSGFPQILQYGDRLLFAWTDTNSRDSSQVKSLLYDISAFPVPSAF